MKNLSRHTGILHIVKQVKHSANGNPRFELFINETATHGVSCGTKPDADYSYEIKNLDGKYVQATIGTYYDKPCLESVQALPQ